MSQVHKEGLFFKAVIGPTYLKDTTSAISSSQWIASYILFALGVKGNTINFFVRLLIICGGFWRIHFFLFDELSKVLDPMVKNFVQGYKEHLRQFK